jgi:hypothetical protein
MRHLVLLTCITGLLVLLLGSCTHHEPIKDTGLNPFDSVINRYVERIDTVRTPPDEYNYLIFKKFIQRDTAWFIDLNKKLKNQDSIYQTYDGNRGCPKEPLLAKMDVEEAYRFSFDEAFNYYRYIITTYKKGNTARLRFVKYGNHIVDSIKRTIDRMDTCMVWNSFEKEITPGEWDSLINKIVYADYWGLKQFNPGPKVTDGSHWRIESISKKWRQTIQHDVYRHEPPNTAFKAIGIYMVHLSGQKISTEY